MTTTLPAFGRAADHRRLGRPVDRPARLRPRLLDRSGRRGAAAPLGRHRPASRRAGPCTPGAASRRRAGAAGGVRRRVRLRPAVLGPGRGSRGGAGAAARRSLLLRRPATTATRHQRPAAAPRRQVRVRRPDHLAGPDHHPSHHPRPVRHRDRGRLAGPHPKQQRHPGHGTRGPRPIVRGTVIRVQLQRVPAKTRPPKVLWLWWAGCGELDLDLAWRAYIRRFDWSTPSGSPSRRWAGQPRGRAIPSRLTAGPGWC
jgi:hypothetical protein